MTQTLSGYHLSPIGSFYCSSLSRNQWRWFTPTVSAMGGNELFIICDNLKKQGWEMSHLIRCLFMPSKISAYIANLPKYFHPFTHLVPPYRLWSRFIANPGQKTQKINCWRNLSPITTVIRLSVGKTSPLCKPTHSCAHKPQFLYSLLSVSLQEALALFGSP